VRLIQKWLNAGVLKRECERLGGGAPAGRKVHRHCWRISTFITSSISGSKHGARSGARGDLIVVRYADDIVVGFEFKGEAEMFWAELKERMQKFQLELHRKRRDCSSSDGHAAANRKRAGLGKPETFDFLGFQAYLRKTKKGRFLVLRQTISKRMQAKLQEVKIELRRRMHDPIPEVGEWLKSVVGGHIRYFGVPGNRYALAHFRFTVSNLWYHVLRRRSQKGRVLWNECNGSSAAGCLRPYLPSLSFAPSARHHLRQEPYAGNPLVRIRAGVRSNPYPYRDHHSSGAEAPPRSHLAIFQRQRVPRLHHVWRLPCAAKQILNGLSQCSMGKTKLIPLSQGTEIHIELLVLHDSQRGVEIVSFFH